MAIKREREREREREFENDQTYKDIMLPLREREPRHLSLFPPTAVTFHQRFGLPFASDGKFAES